MLVAIEHGVHSWNRNPRQNGLSYGVDLVLFRGPIFFIHLKWRHKFYKTNNVHNLVGEHIEHQRRKVNAVFRTFETLKDVVVLDVDPIKIALAAEGAISVLVTRYIGKHPSFVNLFLGKVCQGANLIGDASGFLRAHAIELARNLLSQIKQRFQSVQLPRPEGA